MLVIKNNYRIPDKTAPIKLAILPGIPPLLTPYTNDKTPPGGRFHSTRQSNDYHVFPGKS